ncbi:uncharacterized protein Dvar_00430 [Desulfosarcina variabilis str. Montpellier]|uniref:hypothetical protein n=1 Tax=Desulfosarcina variabilis TaxID=2300 RepID=UPI003AFA8097
MKNNRLFIFMVFFALFIFSGCAPKKIYYFDDVAPTSIQGGTATQGTIAYPPLLRPEGKRKSIRPGSQYFTLAIPNAIDMSGRAQDLQRSLADMLYTELFATGRFNLLDRGELMDLDPEWLTSSLKKSLTDLSKQEDRKAASRSDKDSAEKAESAFDKTFQYLDRKQKSQKRLEDVLNKADGILLVYVTSRVGKQKGGHFSVDYRIVSRRRGGEIVLFAGNKNVSYKSSTTQEVAYNRKDVADIAKSIVNIFPHPKEVRNAQVIKRDQRVIVVDRGRDQHLIAGMIGYVVYSEDSVRLESIGKARHFSYLGEFIITEVFDKTSTAVLLHPRGMSGDSLDEYEWDVQTGDSVIVK